MSDKHIYKVQFVNRDEVYEVYVKSVYQGDMYGFVVLEGFVFGEKSAIVVDPTEDKLRTEFDGVDCSFVPMHEIIRIDRVLKRGTAKIISKDDSGAGKSKVASLYAPEKK